MHRIHQASEPKCCMCMNLTNDSVYAFSCGHHFCKSCKKRFIEKTMACPKCEKENLIRGNQPPGFMSTRTELQKSLPGYEEFGTIVITYNLKEGIQGTVKSFFRPRVSYMYVFKRGWSKRRIPCAPWYIFLKYINCSRHAVKVIFISF